jgi:hypothetical protein
MTRRRQKTGRSLYLLPVRRRRCRFDLDLATVLRSRTQKPGPPSRSPAARVRVSKPLQPETTASEAAAELHSLPLPATPSCVVKKERKTENDDVRKRKRRKRPRRGSGTKAVSRAQTRQYERDRERERKRVEKRVNQTVLAHFVKVVLGCAR